MYADPHPTEARRSAQHAHPGLQAYMHSIAAAGRLRLPVNRAADLFHAAACGVVMTLLGVSKNDRDMALFSGGVRGSPGIHSHGPPGYPGFHRRCGGEHLARSDAVRRRAPSTCFTPLHRGRSGTAARVAGSPHQSALVRSPSRWTANPGAGLHSAPRANYLPAERCHLDRRRAAAERPLYFVSCCTRSA